jgi:hypothetical protein
MSPDPARPDEPPDPGPPEMSPDPAAPDAPPGPGPPEVPPDPAAPEVPLPPMFQAGAQVTVVGAPQRGYIPRLAFGFPKGATTLVSGWIQARQGRLVLATGFVEYCGCPVGLLRAAKKPKRLYFIYIILVSSKKKVFVGKMSPGCTSGPFPSRLSPFLFFPDHPRSLGVPNFHQGAPLKNPFLPPLPLEFSKVLK